MNLVLLGFSHRTAPVEIRERYAVAPDRLSGMNEKLVQTVGLDEAALISTCNRTELVAATSRPDVALERMHAFFQSQLGDGRAEPQHLYELRDGDAVMHLFRVAAGLDSMVLGEAQILGQIKDSYRAAVGARSVGPLLNRLFQRAFRAAKRVRSETGLGASTVSVARVAVQLTTQLFETLSDKAVLLLGAGEMAESALRGLRDAGAERVVVMSRTGEAAERLSARLQGRAATLDTLLEGLIDADVVISSLQLDAPLVDRENLERAMDPRQGRPLLIVDLGIPRNVDPEINAMENVYLYDLDDLEGVADAGRASRQAAVLPAESLLVRERDRFLSWRESLSVSPTIGDLLDHAHRLAETEARRATGQFRHATSDTEEALEGLARRIVAKLLHRPMTRLREETAAGSGRYYADAARRLFGLDTEEDEE